MMDVVAPLGIALTVIAGASLVIFAIEHIPCHNGPCWFRLTVGQLLVLSMLLMSIFIRLLQLLCALVVKQAIQTGAGHGTESEMLVREQGSTHEAAGPAKASTSTSQQKELAKNPSLEETCTLLIRLGSILVLFFICDKTTLLAHVDKHYDRDHFLTICLLLFIGGIMTLKKNHAKDVEILNREQTEEWKGWMQIVFLMYHYYDAQEFYAPIRVFVSCYVWMTGFGNFSFFYVKGDFSWYRAATMLWRLNFVTIFLMLAMDTWYQLYYIVPLHTFYFLLVYTVMAIRSEVNRSPAMLQVKLALLFLVVFLVWDIPGVFAVPFGFLPPALLHDWHFRTYLDHYSAPLGMLFAFCFPVLRLWFAAVERLPTARQWAVKLAVGAALAGAAGASMASVDVFSKTAYNARHPYHAVLCILAFVYWRNIAPVRPRIPPATSPPPLYPSRGAGERRGAEGRRVGLMGGGWGRRPPS